MKEDDGSVRLRIHNLTADPVTIITVDVVKIRDRWPLKPVLRRLGVEVKGTHFPTEIRGFGYLPLHWQWPDDLKTRKVLPIAEQFPTDPLWRLMLRKAIQQGPDDWDFVEPFARPTSPWWKRVFADDPRPRQFAVVVETGVGRERVESGFDLHTCASKKTKVPLI